MKHPEPQHPARAWIAVILLGGYPVIAAKSLLGGARYVEAVSIAGQSLLLIAIAATVAIALHEILHGHPIFQPLVSCAAGLSIYSGLASLIIHLPEGVSHSFFDPDSPIKAMAVSLIAGGFGGALLGRGWASQRAKDHRARRQAAGLPTKLTPFFSRYPVYETEMFRTLAAGFFLMIMIASFYDAGFREATSLGGQAMVPTLVAFGGALKVYTLLHDRGVLQSVITFAVGVAIFGLVASLLIELPEGVDLFLIDPQAPLVAAVGGLASGAFYGGITWLAEQFRARSRNPDSQ